MAEARGCSVLQEQDRILKREDVAELQQQGILLNQTITYNILLPKAVYNIW